MYKENSNLERKLRHPYIRCYAIGLLVSVSLAIILVLCAINSVWYMYRASVFYHNQYSILQQSHLYVAMPWLGKACHRNETDFAVISCRGVKTAYYETEIHFQAINATATTYPQLSETVIMWYRDNYNSLLFITFTYAVTLTMILITLTLLKKQTDCVQRKMERNEYVPITGTLATTDTSDEDGDDPDSIIHHQNVLETHETILRPSNEMKSSFVSSVRQRRVRPFLSKHLTRWTHSPTSPPSVE